MAATVTVTTAGNINSSSGNEKKRKVNDDNDGYCEITTNDGECIVGVLGFIAH
jgi:hypothetical protein